MRTPRGAIVVGVDGTPDSRLAVHWAAAEAERRRAALHLVHALAVGCRELPPTTGEYRRLRVRGERVLDAARAELPPGFALPVTTESDYLPAAPALVAAAADAQLTVVGARGHSLGHDLLVGSVSLQVAHHLTSPLVVVREQADPAARRVVVGVDGSPSSQAALRFALGAAAREGLPVTALHGVTGQRAGTADAERRRAECEEAVAATVAPWAAEHPGVELTVQVVATHPARLLVDASNEACLLVVGAHGRSVVRELGLGSIVQAVLHHGRCPVAIAR